MILTFGDVADARSGRSPPQAMMRLSASCEMRCTVFTTNTAFSAALTKSSTDLVECERHTCDGLIIISSDDKLRETRLG